MEAVNPSKTLFETLQLYTGNSMKEIEQMIAEKVTVLQYLANHNITSIEQVGKVMALYYTDKEYLDSMIKANKVIQ